MNNEGKSCTPLSVNLFRIRRRKKEEEKEQKDEVVALLVVMAVRKIFFEIAPHGERVKYHSKTYISETGTPKNAI